jgi:hypothetical protein
MICRFASRLSPAVLFCGILLQKNKIPAEMAGDQPMYPNGKRPWTID